MSVRGGDKHLKARQASPIPVTALFDRNRLSLITHGTTVTNEFCNLEEDAAVLHEDSEAMRCVWWCAAGIDHVGRKLNMKFCMVQGV